jgi:hypothetical protein
LENKNGTLTDEEIIKHIKLWIEARLDYMNGKF